MTDASSDAERTVTEYFRVWNDRDYSLIPEVVSESFVMYDPWAIGGDVPGPWGEVHGREGLEPFVRSVVDGFPDFHVEVLQMLSDGETVMYTGRVSGTHEGTFVGFPPTGRRLEFRYMGVLRVVDGEVEEHRVYPPLEEIIVQLLASPETVGYLPTLARAAMARLRRALSGA
jgi:steroid delta-isomerase-like uncharacterized protein